MNLRVTLVELLTSIWLVLAGIVFPQDRTVVQQVFNGHFQVFQVKRFDDKRIRLELDAPDWSSIAPFAVSKTMGICEVRRSCFKISMICSPSSPGRIISEIIRSGTRSVRHRDTRNPHPPLHAPHKDCPIAASRKQRRSSLSSITSMECSFCRFTGTSSLKDTGLISDV